MSSSSDARFRELLWLPWWWWLAGLGLGVLGAAQLVSGHVGTRALLGWALVPCVAVLLLVLSLRRVEVVDGELRVPGAVVPVSALGTSEPLDRTGTSLARGRSRAAGAFVPTTPWVPTAVRVDLLDAADPTPHWVVPTRRPAVLVAALKQAAEGVGPGGRGPSS